MVTNCQKDSHANNVIGRELSRQDNWKQTWIGIEYSLAGNPRVFGHSHDKIGRHVVFSRIDFRLATATANRWRFKSKSEENLAFARQVRRCLKVCVWEMATVTAECFQQSTTNTNRPERVSLFVRLSRVQLSALLSDTHTHTPHRHTEGREKSRCQVSVCVCVRLQVWHRVCNVNGRRVPAAIFRVVGGWTFSPFDSLF